MAAELFVLGTSHSVAPTRVRERMHIDLGELYAGLHRILDVPALLDEAVPVATCGRLEVYCLGTRPMRASRVLKELVSKRSGMSCEQLDAHSYMHRGEEAARHLFRVASGLDSVVYGEAQILGQVRNAMVRASDEKAAGSFMKRLFQSALAAGKRVRAETEIGRGSASVAGAALRLLEVESGSLEGKSALVLGAGETGSLVARLLRKAGVGRLTVVNRTLSTAEALATELGGEAYGLDALPQLVLQAEIIVGAVASQEDLVTAGMLRADTGNEARQRYLLDLAHPRNFAADLAKLPGVKLLDLAQVFHRVEEARASRAAQVPLAEAIVEQELETYYRWVRARPSAPVLRAVRDQVLAMAQEEAERRSRGRPAEEREELALFARSLARTLLHAPTVAIRDADSSTQEGRWLLRVAPSMFGIAEDGDVPPDGAR